MASASCSFLFSAFILWFLLPLINAYNTWPQCSIFYGQPSESACEQLLWSTRSVRQGTEAGLAYTDTHGHIFALVGLPRPARDRYDLPISDTQWSGRHDIPIYRANGKISQLADKTKYVANHTNTLVFKYSWLQTRPDPAHPPQRHPRLRVGYLPVHSATRRASPTRLYLHRPRGLEDNDYRVQPRYRSIPAQLPVRQLCHSRNSSWSSNSWRHTPRRAIWGSTSSSPTCTAGGSAR